MNETEELNKILGINPAYHPDQRRLTEWIDNE